MEILSNPVVLLPIIVMLLLITIQFITIGNLKEGWKSVKEDLDQLKIRYEAVVEREKGLEALIENGKLHTIRIEKNNSDYQNTISQLEDKIAELTQKIEKSERLLKGPVEDPTVIKELVKPPVRKRKAPLNPKL